MHKTGFKACFHYLTYFEDLDGFTGVNEEFYECLKTIKVWENCERHTNKKTLTLREGLLLVVGAEGFEPPTPWV